MLCVLFCGCCESLYACSSLLWRSKDISFVNRFARTTVVIFKRCTCSAHARCSIPCFVGKFRKTMEQHKLKMFLCNNRVRRAHQAKRCVSYMHEPVSLYTRRECCIRNVQSCAYNRNIRAKDDYVIHHLFTVYCIRPYTGCLQRHNRRFAKPRDRRWYRKI